MPALTSDRILDVEVSAIRRLRADYMRRLAVAEDDSTAYHFLVGAVEAIDRVLGMEDE